MQAASATSDHHQPLSSENGHKDPERGQCQWFGRVRSFNVSLGCSCIEAIFPPSAHTHQGLPTPWWQQAPRLLCPHDNGPAELSHSAWGVEGKGLTVNVADANGLLMLVAKVCFVAKKDNKMFHYLLCV